MEKYECIKDLQGADWFVNSVFTLEEWRELAKEWANNDGLDGVEKTLEELPENEVMDFIADIWQLEFRTVVEYELKDIDEENQAILISVDGFSIWLDYWENEEGFIEWDFNQQIFINWKGYTSTKDKKTMQAQEKIRNDIGNFDYFMDDIFNNWGDALNAVEAIKKYENRKAVE